jgi:hypothetical protein
MVVVDDFSRYVWVKFLREKSRGATALTDLILLLENQLSQKVGTVLSDRGGEFLSEKFIEFCNSKGIARQLTNPETPEQNKVAERMNRTLLEKARSMCLQAKTPKSMWTEAVNTAAFITNRCPTKSYPDMTPFQLLNNKKPSLDHLRVFECRIYVLQKEKELTKWASRSIEGIFLGYDDHTKGFRCWIPSLHRLVISRNVKFDESSMLLHRMRTTEDTIDSAQLPTVEEYSPQQNSQELGQPPPSPHPDTARPAPVVSASQSQETHPPRSWPSAKHCCVTCTFGYGFASTVVPGGDEHDVAGTASSCCPSTTCHHRITTSILHRTTTLSPSMETISQAMGLLARMRRHTRNRRTRRN